MKPFTVTPSKADLRQLYASAESHQWVKDRALENDAKMIDVVDALIRFTEQAEKDMDELYTVFCNTVDRLYASGEAVPPELEKLIEAMEDKYGEPDNAD